MRNRGVISRPLISAALLLQLSLSGCGGGAGAGSTTATSWAQPVYSLTDDAPPVLWLGAPDARTGGWNLATGSWDASGSVADVVIDENGNIGAFGVARSQAGFNINPEPSLQSYKSLRLNGVGDVFVVGLRNGKHAKLRIDFLTSGLAWDTYSSISFSYLLEQGVGATAAPVCTAAPVPPVSVVASQTAYGTVTFTWQPSAGATSYALYSQGTPGVSKASSKKSITTWQTNAQGLGVYTLTNVPLGTYYGAMTASNSCGESGFSAEGGPTNVVTVAPSAPTIYTATPGNTQATVTWADQAGATSYNTYWSITSGVTKLNGFLVPNVPSGQTFTGMVNDTTYYVVVTAVNSAGESAESAQLSVTPFDPMVPRIESATIKPYWNRSIIELRVTDLSGGLASGWNVYRSVTPGVAITPSNLVGNSYSGTVWLQSGTSHYFNDTSILTAGTTYYYRATSVTAGGTESTASNEVAITF